MIDFERLDQIAAKLMQKRKAHLEREVGSIYEHGKRVARLIVALRARALPEATDWDDILRIAAMFHDVGKGIEPHAHYGALIFREAVRGELPEEVIAQAARLIEAHCDRRPTEPKHDVWARLLQDADLLDHLGVYEIWMNFNYNAHHGAGISEAVAFYRTELEPYIARQRAAINLPESLAVLDEKCDFLRRFCRRMEAEANGDIYERDPR